MSAFLTWFCCLAGPIVGPAAGMSSAAAPGMAPDNPAPAESATRRNRWEVAVQGWVPRLRADFSSGAGSAQGETGGGTVLGGLTDNESGIDVYGLTQATYHGDQWYVRARVIFGRSKSPTAFTEDGGDTIEAKFGTVVPGVTVGYKLGRREWTNGMSFHMWLYGGVRVPNLDVKLGDGGNAAIDIDDRWLDPLIGLRMPFLFSRRWSMQLSADMAVFGQSDSAWSVELEAVWQVMSLVSARIGWMILDMRFEEEVESQSVVYDVLLRGPRAGVTFHF